jgi:hypothetical protein
MNQHTESPDLIGPVLKVKLLNFKALEDCMLASAYAFVTTNAAIGTDQDGKTFWTKIRATSFVAKGSLLALWSRSSTDSTWFYRRR